MTTSKHLLAALFLTSVLCYAPISLADKGGNGHGKEHGHGNDNGDDRDNDRRHDDDGHGRKVAVRYDDRVIIRRYISEDYRAHCPPGLAKKHNGCRPPGHVRHYVIGQPLEETIVWRPVPQPLLVQLQPVPYGYQYVMVDKDVLLISEASKNVIDAITLLSAVGR